MRERVAVGKLSPMNSPNPIPAILAKAPDYSDSALILVGHGSTVNADSASPTHRQAEQLLRRGIFAEVHTCFWKEQPVISAVLRGVAARRVFVVPLFISEGYFTQQVIPRELGLAIPEGPGPGWGVGQVRGNQLIHYCAPVGTHPSMTRVLLARALSVVDEAPVPEGSQRPKREDCSLFIAGHGTGNSENSREAIEAQSAAIGAMKLYRDVHAVFMEEEPRIEAADRLAKTENMVVVPFFIADGLHSFEDIPVMLGAAPEEVRARLESGQPTWINPTRRHGKWVWYSRSIGEEPCLADVVLERVREADAAGR